MAVKRVEWTCPGCGRKYAIPVDATSPSLCPKCRNNLEALSQVPAPVVNDDPAPAVNDTVQFDADAEAYAAAVATIATEQPESEPALFQPQLAPPPPTRPIHSGRRAKFAALRTIALCYKVFAMLVAVAAAVGIFLSMRTVAATEASPERTMAILSGLATFAGGAVASVSLFAFAELIRVLLEIEENTRAR